MSLPVQTHWRPVYDEGQLIFEVLAISFRAVSGVSAARGPHELGRVPEVST